MLHILPFQVQVTIYRYYGDDIADLNFLIKVNWQMFANYIDYLYDYSPIVLQFNQHKKSREKTMARFNFVMACLVANAGKNISYTNRKQEFSFHFNQLFREAHKNPCVAVDSGLCKYENIVLASISNSAYLPAKFAWQLKHGRQKLISSVPKCFLENREFVKKVANFLPSVLNFACSDLQDDEETVIAVFKSKFEMQIQARSEDYYGLFKCVSPRLKNDGNFIGQLVKLIEILTESNQIDSQEVRFMVLSILENISPELLDNKEFIKKYLGKYKSLYESLSDKLLDDEELWLLCNNEKLSRNYASERLCEKFCKDFLSECEENV